MAVWYFNVIAKLKDHVYEIPNCSLKFASTKKSTAAWPRA